MRRKSIVSFLCSFALLINQIPFPAVTIHAEEEKSVITLDDDFYNFIRVDEKMYDRNADASLNFDKVPLIGKSETDRIELTATAIYDDYNAGTDKIITVTDFRIVGDDADHFELQLKAEQETISLKGDISPKEIQVSPEKIQVSEITEFPAEVEYTFSEESILKDDELQVYPTLMIDKSSESNDFYVYYFEYNYQPMDLNYRFVIDKDVATVSDNNRIQVKLEQGFENELTYSKTYDGNTDIENMDFSSVNLIGIENDADVSLTATASFEDANAGEDKPIKLTDFKLQGTDADKYHLSLSQEEIYIYGEIKPLEIPLIPVGEIARGEKSKKIGFDTEKVNQSIIGGDTVNILSEIWIEKDLTTNEYVYVIKNSPTTNNPNYIAVLSETAIPEIANPSEAIILLPAVITPNQATVLQYSNTGEIITNGSVTLTLTAKTREKIEDGVTFRLSNNQEITKVLDDNDQKVSLPDGDFYIYTVNFDLALSKNEDDTETEFEKRIDNLTCVVKNGETISEEKKISFCISGYEEVTDIILMDKSAPILEDNDVTINANNQDKTLTLNGHISDSMSGIKTVEYSWNKENYQELKVEKGNDDRTAEISLYAPISYQQANEQGAVKKDGKYILYIKAIDNAGNECVKEYYSDILDETPPELRYVCLEPTQPEAWEKILNVLTFGNYVNQSLTLTLKVQDKLNDGQTFGEIKRVDLIDKNAEQEILFSKENELEKFKDENSVYTFVFDELNPPTEDAEQKFFVINNWYLRITDTNNNVTEISVREALKTEFQSEQTENPIQTDTTASIVSETTTEKILPDPYLQSVTNDKWIFDATPPNIEFSYGGVELNGVQYYGLDSKEGSVFTITVSDDGGIASLNIIENYYSDYDYNTSISPRESRTITLDDITDGGWYHCDVDAENPNKRVYTFDTNDDNIYPTGWYTYSVTVVDFAGNITSNEKEPEETTAFTEAKGTTTTTIVETLSTKTTSQNSTSATTTTSVTTTTDTTTTQATTTTTETTVVLLGTKENLEECKFYVDHKLPDGEIKHSFPEHKELPENHVDTDFETWIVEKDENDKTQAITFRLYPEKISSPLYKFNIWINSDNAEDVPVFSFNVNDLQIDEKTGKRYIEFTIDPNELDENNIPRFSYTNEHLYEIHAQIIAESGNQYNTDFELHVDTQIPEIDRFTVEKKNSAADTILNVLTFGTFANDSLRFKAYVHDADYDSGVDYVTIQYDGIDSPVKMELVEDENDVYYYDLDLETQIFQSDILITVYDKMGKSSIECPNIQNTDATEFSENHFVMQETILPEVSISVPAGDGVERSDGQIWYRTDKEILLTVQDLNSGIREIEFLVNGQYIDADISDNPLLTIETTRAAERRNTEKLQYTFSTENFAQNIPPNEDGSYQLEVTVVDNAGNVSSTEATYYRDVISPIVNQFVFNPVTSDSIGETSDFIEKLEYGFYFKQEFEALVQVSDAAPSSGLNLVEFRFVPYENGSEKEAWADSSPIINGEAVYTIPAGFKGQIYAKAADNVGNISDERLPQGFVIDNEKPNIQITISGSGTGKKDATESEIYVSEVALTVVITDTVSGLKSISYSQASESGTYNEKADTVIENIADTLENGWEITGRDANLITQVTKTFYFDNDDNAISMSFSATDRSGNDANANSYDDDQLGEFFTVDTTKPEIKIVSSKDSIEGAYPKLYADEVEYTVTIKERNFNPELIKAEINNSFKAENLPNGITEHIENDTLYYTLGDFESVEGQDYTYQSTLTFNKEGNYTFSFTGEDMGGNFANFTDGISGDSFSVDATPPVIITNFKVFDPEGGNGYFNAIKGHDKEIPQLKITVSDDNSKFNFAPSYLNIEVDYKEAYYLDENGKKVKNSHDDSGWTKLGLGNWNDNGDEHIFTLNFEKEGIYKISITSPLDRAGHSAQIRDNAEIQDVYTTAIFELDKTPPELSERIIKDVSVKSTDNFKTEYTAIYESSDENADAPKIIFDDINFDRIELRDGSAMYTTSYNNGSLKTAEKVGNLDSKSIMKKFDSSINTGNIIDLTTCFNDDGVYILEYTAYDKAGNQYSVQKDDGTSKNAEIKDTYFRMVKKDTFAYIKMDSYEFFTDVSNDSDNTESPHGRKLSDFENENPDLNGNRYKQFEIAVINKKNAENTGVLYLEDRDNSNKPQYIPEEGTGDNAVVKVSDKMNLSDTAELYSLCLDGSYFSRIIQEGETKTLALFVSNGKAADKYYGLELVNIYIDNDPPTADVPEDFKDGHEYLFTNEQVITLTNVSTDLDDTNTLILDYADNVSNNYIEVPFYFDKQKKELTFTLSKGIHNIDIILQDTVGNLSTDNDKTNIYRRKNIIVGNSNLYKKVGAGVTVIGTIAVIVFIKKKRET